MKKKSLFDKCLTFATIYMMTYVFLYEMVKLVIQVGKQNKIKTFFNGRRWNLVRTRKKILVFTILFVVGYTIINLAMTALSVTPDSTLTSELFGYCKWLVATGTSITLADKIIPSKNSEEVVGDEVEE